MDISTKKLDALPKIGELNDLCRALATLDAILCREWAQRYYSYNNAWDKKAGEEVFQMQNGQGDDFFILFNSHGAIINGFAVESEMSEWYEREVKPTTFTEKLSSLFGKKKKAFLEQDVWKGIIDSVPEEFREFITEEPIKSKGTTFCVWRKFSDDRWKIGEIEFPDSEYRDGSQDFLYILDDNPSTYREWALEYYEIEPSRLTLEMVKHVYDHKSVNQEFVLAMNPVIKDWDELAKDLDEIGYAHTIGMEQQNPLEGPTFFEGVTEDILNPVNLEPHEWRKKLKSTIGGMKFRIKYYGKQHQEYPNLIVSTDFAPAFVVAVCETSGQEITLFDGCRFGYNALFCDTFTHEQLHDRPLDRFYKDATGNEVFEIVISTYNGIDYDDEFGDLVDEDGMIELADGSLTEFDTAKRDGFDTMQVWITDNRGETYELISEELA
ncbi:hypothetical protein HUK80_16415 [Flavobacterium sp. MAH-1]|uniref:Uncharacterized protein n=1 Tax=Flavobacterium agri TaxID=2743471 RepID=A0A7Y8Y7B7_9FLAO|nr:hypothetical protein [Flavobacterium agri]NUY82491.1 hypothetical protein [Flavobacterium agri]NYA72515.1 hypothetical protein [Flavobacterium agri]